MKSVLVDSSIWIDYFKSGDSSADMDELIEQNLIVTNELILAELTPFLRLKNQRKLIKLLEKIKQLPLEINWQEITDMQTACLKNGMNGIGIPDLIIAQNVQQQGAQIYSLDKHFVRIEQVYKIALYQPIRI